VTAQYGVTSLVEDLASGSSNPGSSVIAVDPSTEAPIEARNFQGSPTDFSGITSSYLPLTPTSSVATGGKSGSAAILWLDPIGSPSVVDASSLPPAVTSTRDFMSGDHVK
jgi:hypothetical protein